MVFEAKKTNNFSLNIETLKLSTQTIINVKNNGPKIKNSII